MDDNRLQYRKGEAMTLGHSVDAERREKERELARIGHNMPPENEQPSGWTKSYFYMPVEEAEITVALLKTMKGMFPFPSSKAAKNVAKIIDERIAFLERKMQ